MSHLYPDWETVTPSRGPAHTRHPVSVAVGSKDLVLRPDDRMFYEAEPVDFSIYEQAPFWLHLPKSSEDDSIDVSEDGNKGQALA